MLDLSLWTGVNAFYRELRRRIGAEARKRQPTAGARYVTIAPLFCARSRGHAARMTFISLCAPSACSVSCRRRTSKSQACFSVSPATHRKFPSYGRSLMLRVGLLARAGRNRTRDLDQIRRSRSGPPAYEGCGSRDGGTRGTGSDHGRYGPPGEDQVQLGTGWSHLSIGVQ
jgi:hypothetical protein